MTGLFYGGTDRACIHLCNYQVQVCEVYLISLCDQTNTKYSLECLDTRVKLITLGKHTGLNMRLFFRLYYTLRSIMPSIIHTHAIGLFYSFPYIIANRKSKVFHTVHSPAEKDAPGPYHYCYLVLLRLRSIQMVANSKSVSESMKKLYGRSHCKYIHLGISELKPSDKRFQVQKEVHGYRRSEHTKIFIHIGRIAPEKDQHLLYAAFHLLIEERYDVILLVLGEIQSLGVFSRLEKLSHPNIHYLGSKDNVFDYLAVADAFCLTSQYEGLSLATIEAMSMKVIPICTPVGGIPEVVQDGYNGILSRDCTLGSYVQALKRFLYMDEQTKARMRENAFQTYNDRFTIERCGAEYLRLYNDALHDYLS